MYNGLQIQNEMKVDIILRNYFEKQAVNAVGERKQKVDDRERETY